MPAPPPSSLLLSLRNVYETLAICAPTVVDAARGRLTHEACNDRLESWASRVVHNAEVALTVRGREHVDRTRTYVVMSNHQSHYDVPVLYYVLGPNVRMVAKSELFELPVFGRALREAGFVPVDRRDTKRAVASLATARQHLAGGTHVWIAPEGTRSVTGELGPFKKGGFVLALDTGAPVLPITIRGTRDMLRAKGVRSRAGADVEVTIHPAVETSTFAGDDKKAARDALMGAVRAAIASALRGS